MLTFIKNISSLCTLSSGNPIARRGDEMQNITEIKNGAIIFNEKIEFVGTTEEAQKRIVEKQLKIDKTIDATGKTIIPGFCDSHTHIVFAGDRSDEFARRLRGVTYKEIAEEGGGILHTMKATRKASLEELVQAGKKLALSAMKYGTTSIEIKSGYSLTTEGELNQLRAIKQLKKELPLNIRSTFMGAHDFPPEYKNNREKYVDLIINEMIPAVAEEKLADYCDAFIDEGYYTLDEAEKIFEAAKKYGMKIRTHSDEMADVGAAGFSADIGAVSADHLLFASDKSIVKMAKSDIVATMMPATAYFIRMPYAPARKMIKAGCCVALASDCNPGSSFTENMQLVLSLAVINMKMTAEESLTAATLNGAKAMNLSEVTGSLAPGKQADFIIANVNSYVDIFYHFGINHVDEVWIKGKNIVKNTSEFSI
ncbi:MAG: imidazolonepropionase [Ignavibacteria bacterium]|jgi:imidazolonepropionase|nr:imidazolonepropionase [Ignavibacteria bacterium]